MVKSCGIGGGLYQLGDGEGVTLGETETVLVADIVGGAETVDDNVASAEAETEADTDAEEDGVPEFVPLDDMDAIGVSDEVAEKDGTGDQLA